MVGWLLVISQNQKGFGCLPLVITITKKLVWKWLMVMVTEVVSKTRVPIAQIKAPSGYYVLVQNTRTVYQGSSTTK